MEAKYEIWVEIQANKHCITSPAAFEGAMLKCKAMGATGIILSVKDTSGFVIYNSALAPHYSGYDAVFKKDTDYVQSCFDAIRRAGMQCYAAFDVFAEGSKATPRKGMKGLEKDGWQCEIYGLDENNKPAICKSTDAAHLATVGSIDDFGEIFVNPANPEVCQYELSLLEEFAVKYHPDGIVLDRVRYVGLSADFSKLSLDGLQKYIGTDEPVRPQDIYTIQNDGGVFKEIPGKYYGSFFEYRAAQIKGFMVQVSEMLKRTAPAVQLCSYTGSWYPLYDKVGVNWASEAYTPTEFPACNAQKLQKTAYAESVGRLLSGFYYEDIRVDDAEKSGKPFYWYSVEGAAQMAAKATCGKVPLTGSLFIEQYKQHPERLPDAIAMCMRHTGGCMLFDLSYIDKYNWQYSARGVYTAPLTSADLAEMGEICAECFPEKYHITESRLAADLLLRDDFDAQHSLKLCSLADNRMLGFIGVKKSSDETLYPHTAWLSIIAVRAKEQGIGCGTALVNTVCAALRADGIRRVYLGQDFDCLFSGIPEPNEAKCRFFKNKGFALNFENHYDLEADITANPLIEGFDSAPFDEYLCTDTYNNNKNELLCFLKAEFPGRWEYEAEEALRQNKSPEQILLLWNKEHTHLLGYCMLSVDANGYGGLGPIGIAKQLRGRHAGDYLLCKALMQLKKIGAVRVNIDWTILVKFYGQFGFVPQRTYLAAYIDFENKE